MSRLALVLHIVQLYTSPWLECILCESMTSSSSNYLNEMEACSYWCIYVYMYVTLLWLCYREVDCVKLLTLPSDMILHSVSLLLNAAVINRQENRVRLSEIHVPYVWHCVCMHSVIAVNYWLCTVIFLCTMYLHVYVYMCMWVWCIHDMLLVASHEPQLRSYNYLVYPQTPLFLDQPTLCMYIVPPSHKWNCLY